MTRALAETTTSKKRFKRTVEREGSRVSYSSTGSSATSERRGEAPDGPRSGETTLSFTCSSRQIPASCPIKLRVHPLPGHDQPIQSRDELVHGRRPIVARPHRGEVAVGDQMEMHVGEQLDLASRGPSQLAVAQHGRQFQRGGVAPEPAHGPAEDPRGKRAHEPRAGRGGETDVTGGRERQQQTQHRGAGGHPGSDHRQLVDGEVPDTALVAVIEAKELGDQHPRRQHGQRPRRARGRAGDEHAHQGTNPDVRDGQHPPQPHVAPEAIGSGLPERQEIRHLRGGRTRRNARPRGGRVRPRLLMLAQTLSRAHRRYRLTIAKSVKPPLTHTHNELPGPQPAYSNSAVLWPSRRDSIT